MDTASLKTCDAVLLRNPVRPVNSIFFIDSAEFNANRTSLQFR